MRWEEMRWNENQSKRMEEFVCVYVCHNRRGFKLKFKEETGSSSRIDRILKHKLYNRLVWVIRIIWMIFPSCEIKKEYEGKQGEN